jgi:haloalkane dehalogenase
MNQTRRQYVDVSHGQVHFRTDRGPEDRTPLIILHQSPLSSRNYERFIPHLSPLVRPIAIDTPGHGMSDWVDKEWEISDYATAMWEVLDALGIERTGILARATGSTIAVQMILQRPDRVIGPAMFHGLPIYTDEERLDRLDNFAPPYPADDDGSHVTALWQRITGQYPYFPGWETTHHLVDHLLSGPDFARAYRGVFRYDMPAAIPHLLEALEEEPFVFYGDRDRIGFMMERAVDRLPAGTVHLLENSTDFVAEEDPEHLLEFLRAPLSRISGR